MTKEEKEPGDDELRCKRNDGNSWRCKLWSSEGSKYCRKHFLHFQHLLSKNRKSSNKKKRFQRKERVEMGDDLYLSEGQEVEVKRDGFPNSWFIATIVERLTHEKKYLVEYQNLVDKSEGKQLREHVNFCDVRPLQPKETQTPQLFKLLEEVDAFYCDGWRKGVISKVYDDSRYSVCFTSTGEELDFQLSDLRSHLEWVNGEWVNTSQVEETTVVAQNEADLQSPSSTGCYVLRTSVSSPQTPSEVGSILLENVSGSMDNVTPNEAGASYAVFSRKKNTKQSDPESNPEFSRPCKKVKERKETNAPACIEPCGGRETSKGSPVDEHLHPFQTTKEYSEVIVLPKDQVQWQKEKPNLPIHKLKAALPDPLINLQGVDKSENLSANVIKRRRGRPFGSGKKPKNRRLGSRAMPGSFQLKEPDNGSTSSKMTNVQSESTKLRKDNLEEPTLSVFLRKNDTPKRKNNGNGTEDEATLIPTLKKHQTVSLCLQESNAPTSGDVEEEAGNSYLTTVQINCTQSSNVTFEEHQTISLFHEKSNLSPWDDNKDNNFMPSEAIVLRDTSMNEPQQPQSSKEVESSFTLNAKVDTRGLQSFDDVVMNTCSSSVQHAEGPLPQEKESLPFVKKSDIWGILESMEEFKLMPQNPHFQPLEKEILEFREGFAVGLMSSFVKLMKRTYKANLDDPIIMFKSTLTALTELEVHGFTVDPLRSRMEELLKLKDSYNQLDDTLKTTEQEVIVEKHQYNEIQESIAGLYMELQALLAEKERKSSRVAELQKTVDEMKGRVDDARSRFDGVVATPW